MEVCFPTGTYDNNNGNDLRFMDELLQYIETNNIPAPAPIEQRWSRTSSSLMSPSHSNHPQGLHSWVGYVHHLLFYTHTYTHSFMTSIVSDKHKYTCTQNETLFYLFFIWNSFIILLFQ